MADRITEDADRLVDEVKRKARRRLVGAIVLALAAAIILPLLLEKEPRPLGDDVSVQIPPVDEGKFVNRLTARSGDAKAPAKTDDKAGAKVAGANADAKPEAGGVIAAPAAIPALPPRAAPGEAAATKAPAAETEPRAAAPASKPIVAADAAPASAADVKTDSRPAPAEAKPAPAATAVAPAAKPDGFVVQLAAFADDKGANALANRLKKAGYAAYVEPVQTSRGTLWRVRVGGYGARPDADAARAKLRSEGYSGIVTPAR